MKTINKEELIEAIASRLEQYAFKELILELPKESK